MVSVLFHRLQWQLFDEGMTFNENVFSVAKTFFFQPVEDWLSDAGYCEARSFLKSIPVVNDLAEQGVKLCFDYLDSARFNKLIEY